MNSQSLLNFPNLTRMASYESKQIFFKCSQPHKGFLIRIQKILSHHDGDHANFFRSQQLIFGRLFLLHGGLITFSSQSDLDLLQNYNGGQRNVGKIPTMGTGRIITYMDILPTLSLLHEIFITFQLSAETSSSLGYTSSFSLSVFI